MPSYVVEYSFEQRCFHIDTVAQSLKNNLVMFAEGRRSQYMPVAHARTYVEASILCKGFKHAIDVNGVPGETGCNLDMRLVMGKVKAECRLALESNSYPGSTGENDTLSEQDRDSLNALLMSANMALSGI